MLKDEKKSEDFVGQFLVDYKILTREELQWSNNRRELVMSWISDNSIEKITIFLQVKAELRVLESTETTLSTIEETIDEDLKTGVLEVLRNRVNEMYNMLFLLYPATSAFLKSYISFCKKNELLDECSLTMKVMLTMLQTNVDVYTHAAEFEVECKDDIVQARVYYEEAMRLHANNADLKWLHVNRFKMEIEYCSKKGSDYNECFKCFLRTINTFKDKHVEFFWEFFFFSLHYPNINPKLQSSIADEIVKIYKSYDKRWYTVQQDEFIRDTFFKQVGVILRYDSLPLWEVMLKCAQGTEHRDLVFKMHHKAACSRGNLARLIRPKFLEMSFHRRGLTNTRRAFNALKSREPLAVEFYQTIIRLEVNTNTIRVKNPKRPERIREREKTMESLRSIYSEACSIFGETNTEIWMDYIRFENDYGNKENVYKVYEESKKHLSLEQMPTMESEFEHFKTNILDNQGRPGCSKDDDDQSQEIIEIDD